MNSDIGTHLSELVDKLYDIHIELWDVVDLKKSEDDKKVLYAARNNNRLVKMRSDCVEQIDEALIRLINYTKQGRTEMNGSIGDIIEELGFEKISIHESNRGTNRKDEPSATSILLKQKLQNAINTIISVGD